MYLLVYALVLPSSYIYWARDRWDSPIDCHLVQVHRYLCLRPSQHLPYSFNTIDHPLSMLSASSTGSAHTRAPDSIMIPTDNAFTEIETQLANPPQEIHSNPIAIPIVSWVAGVITLLLRFIRAMHRNFHDANAEFLARIDAIEEAADPDHSSTESGGLPSHRADVGTSRAEASSRGGAAARRRQCCSKCHAHGHSTDACLTIDPVSMRKRIASNQKARRSARSKVAPGPIPPLVQPPPHPLYAAYATPADTALVTAAIADAEELRRRKRQSGRDRKKHRAATATPR